MLELLIISGSVFAFVHAWRRWRRHGDPVNIALWCGSLIYLAVVEPPLYFPSWFGLDKYVGFIFSHNVFTVQLMYDRLPLYIVAFYTVITQLTYEVVRALGIFAKRGPLVGALATAFASQVFYETFDQLGPQWRWWAWNTDNAVNQPMFASVPMNSMWVYASVSFGILVWLVVRLMGPRAGRGSLTGRQVALRTLAAGVLTPVLMVVGAAPTRVGTSADGSHTLQRTLVWILLGALWAVGLWLLADATRRTWAGTRGGVASPWFARVYPAAYLGVHVALWAVALPALLDATDGVTSSGAPVGSAWYAAACILASGWFVLAAYRATRQRPGPRAVTA
ncbi:hypothetical protein GCM10027076_08320 [Nocardioides montaniterrae]